MSFAPLAGTKRLISMRDCVQLRGHQKIDLALPSAAGSFAGLHQTQRNGSRLSTVLACDGAVCQRRKQPAVAGLWDLLLATSVVNDVSPPTRARGTSPHVVGRSVDQSRYGCVWWLVSGGTDQVYRPRGLFGESCRCGVVMHGGTQPSTHMPATRAAAHLEREYDLHDRLTLFSLLSHSSADSDRWFERRSLKHIHTSNNSHRGTSTSSAVSFLNQSMVCG